MRRPQVKRQTGFECVQLQGAADEGLSESIVDLTSQTKTLLKNKAGSIRFADKLSLEKRLRRGFMPIYEYLCKRCSLQFEYLRLYSSAPATCPVCSSDDLDQLISTYAVRSESTTQANLAAAHRKAAAARGARQHEEHIHHHEHFEDRPTGTSQLRTDHEQKKSDA
jgi:putative FmdB family regulatory protein